ncbi:MAG: tRNA (adenosine(37)-N6)-threonylcarbamoyltransferase complex transferase subunit TsaD [Leptospiraceae bacterium]|nr:tRNA (adenosine(37)-N6)-threonylcarbamoyltransferase complex transferase subunit TsaD [Leptospiraceae bacterium]MCP5498071.1 tRNA (adenosine(37)-N6)-threonylcarbamoyltransferase complex transferase subunit TsaD [Leptospiraceae bacterium]
MIGLGIETSCDETSIGIVENGTKILSLKLFSQIKIHSPYKGVVPEIASRSHLEKINILLEDAFIESNLSDEGIDYISVTYSPGLMGSLMIGAQMARCLSFVLKKPLVCVDHLEAHLNAVKLENKFPTFPFIGVLLSGGNSSIFVVKGYQNMEVIGDTMDDALGEAFDKVAKLLNLSYPGGPEIEKMANNYNPPNPEKPIFPELLKELSDEKIQFSYSGLKTSVMYYIKKKQLNLIDVQKICYHFQNSAFSLVEKNIAKTVNLTGIKKIVCAGGVLANETLRKRLQKLAIKMNLILYFPESKILCTDNGAMVASLGYEIFKMGKLNPIDFKISPRRKESDIL